LLTTNPLEANGNDEVATIWRDYKSIDHFGSTLIASLSASPGRTEGQELGKQLVLAYNSTYGAGTNPEALSDLLDAIKYAIEIKDLWSADQYGTISADQEGEMQALAKMEEKFKAAINKAKL
jgi:hypothetical protein